MGKRLAGAVLILFFLAGVVWAEDYLEPYPSLEEVYQQLKDFSGAYSELAQLEKFGESKQGRPLYLLRVKASEEDLPKVLITAGIHACEYIGVSVALAFAQHILERAEEPEVRSLLEKVEIDIAPLLNPDGYARVWENKGKGGKIGIRKNAGGVDLNRNFPPVPGVKSYHPLSGNRRSRSSYYMGPEPLSEPESRAVAKIMAFAFLVAYFYMLSLARVSAQEVGFYQDLFFWVMIVGILGAKLLYIIVEWRSVFSDFSFRGLVNCLRGGLVWYGGVVANLGFIYFYCKRKEKSFALVADLSLIHI